MGEEERHLVRRAGEIDELESPEAKGLMGALREISKGQGKGRRPEPRDGMYPVSFQSTLSFRFNLLLRSESDLLNLKVCFAPVDGRDL